MRDLYTDNVIEFQGMSPAELSLDDSIEKARLVAFIAKLWASRDKMFLNCGVVLFPKFGVRVLLRASGRACKVDGVSYPYNISVRQIEVMEIHRKQGHCTHLIQLLRDTLAKLEDSVKLCVVDILHPWFYDYFLRHGAKPIDYKPSDVIFVD